MRAVDVIIKKRQGQGLTEEEIRFLIQGYVGGSIPDYQMSSFAMAVFFKGMSFEETGFLTRAMIDSGEVIDLSGIDRPLVDKHSTGGVGDKVSLVLAPLAAACGCTVPMMSGRALGHTGGTLDKLESIPGYRTDLSVKRFTELLRGTGFAMTGQSEKIVPADRMMYALRDVTGTVESIPLITASIMSKKFAEGAESLVFDVKCGSGAFMKTLEEARGLAVSLVRTGNNLGRRIRAVISDMDQPLGFMVGNFLEVREVISVLRGGGPKDLLDLTVRLTAHMLVLGGLQSDMSAAEAECRRRLEDGSAWKKFVENVELQGGDVRAVEQEEAGPRAPLIEPVEATSSGYVQRIDAYQIGIAAGLLGASRETKEDEVLPDVGIELKKIQGNAVQVGEALCLIHGRDSERIARTRSYVQAAYSIGGSKAEPRGRVIEEIREDDLGKV
ncbi:MAG: thymidine phosphorylase [Spirochaetaceae bacterium]|nr:MAG: thymidine phosphorylase [Spirochaetaceae bacterium]